MPLASAGKARDPAVEPGDLGELSETVGASVGGAQRLSKSQPSGLALGVAGVITPVPPVANFAAYKIPYLLGTGAFAARDLMHQVQRTIDGWRSDRAKPDQQKRPVEEE
jgi:hypothetical protein